MDSDNLAVALDLLTTAVVFAAIGAAIGALAGWYRHGREGIALSAGTGALFAALVGVFGTVWGSVIMSVIFVAALLLT